MPAPQNLRADGDRIEQALDELQAHGRPAHRRPGRGAAAPGLRALRRRAWPGSSSSPGARAPELIDALRRRRAGGQPAAGPGPAPRVRSTPGWRRRWRPVRPFLAQHGGDVELLGIDDELGAVKLRLLGQLRRLPVVGRDAAGRGRGGHLGGGARDRPHRRRGAGASAAVRVPSRLGHQAACTTSARPRWSAR